MTVRSLLVAEPETQAQAGVFIVRIWKEPHSPSGFRARIVRTVDLNAPRETLSAADTAAEVCEAVQEWIDQFVSSSD